MDKNDLINDYIEGSISPDDERSLFAEMSFSDELRDEFKSRLYFEDALKSGLNSFEPGLSTTGKVFDRLGYRLPSAIPAKEELIGKKSYLIIPWLRFMIPALVLLLLTGLGYFVINSTKFNNSNFVESLPVKANDYPLLSSTELIDDNSFVNSKKADNVSNKNKAVKSSKTNGSIRINPVETFYIYSDEIRVANIELSQSFVKYYPHFPKASEPVIISSAYIDNYNYNDNVYSNMNNFDDNENGKILFVEQHYYYYSHFPSPTINPEKFSNLNNLGLSFIYNPSGSYYAIGLDIRQETFFAKYEGNANSGKEFDYEQQPNFTSYGLLVRYHLTDNDSYKPFLQLGFSGNNAGIAIRPLAGIDLQLISYLHLSISLEYSRFWFSHQDNNFTAEKIGVCGGLKLKL